MVGVRSADDEPVAVLQGYGFDLTWQQLNEAAIAIHRGAHWVATNTDLDPADRSRAGAGQRRRGGRGPAWRWRPSRRWRASRTGPCWTRLSPGSARSGRSSSATGWTPTSRAQWAPVWTACWCCPAPTERGTCWQRRARRSGRPISGQDLRALLDAAAAVRSGATGLRLRVGDAPGPRARTCWSAGRIQTGCRPCGPRRTQPGRPPIRVAGRPGDQASCTALISSTAAQTRYASTAGHSAASTEPGPHHHVRRRAGQRDDGVEQQPVDRGHAGWPRC